MPDYYLNRTRSNEGDYEVHEQGCYWLTLVNDREYLGWHANCHGAVSEAKRRYPNKYRINGCKHCCPACHTS